MNTIDVVETFEKYGVSTLVIPKGAGFLLNTCDAYFHSVEKKLYWRRISENPETKSLEERAFDISEAYYSVGGDCIRHYFERCGLIGDRNSTEVARDLIREGIHNMSSIDAYQKYLNAYLSWKQ